MAKEKPFQVEAGRLITFHGEDFITIHREGKTAPVEADDVTHFICEQLNRAWSKR